jgi:CYTH domain-containing protein
MPSRSKYARIERERRFLLDRFPDSPKASRVRRISDRYIAGTTVRLREQRDEAGAAIFKLTQKLPSPGKGARQGMITSMYLTAEEFAVFAQLPAKTLRKIRYSLPPFGIDVFDGRLQGLILAEAEFDSAAGARALMLPSFAACEVSDDHRFTGGRLARVSRGDLCKWLSEFDIPLAPRPR